MGLFRAGTRHGPCNWMHAFVSLSFGRCLPSLLGRWGRLPFYGCGSRAVLFLMRGFLKKHEEAVGETDGSKTGNNS